MYQLSIERLGPEFELQGAIYTATNPVLRAWNEASRQRSGNETSMRWSGNEASRQQSGNETSMRWSGNEASRVLYTILIVIIISNDYL